MKKCFILILFALVAVAPLEAQFAKPLKNKKVGEGNGAVPWSLGITGAYGWNDMMYTATNTVKAVGYHAPNFGLSAEYNAFDGLAVGLDVSYAMRGTRKETTSTFLTDYSTTNSAHVSYEMTLRAVEARIPVTFYFGSSDILKPYVYLAPRVSVWLGDSIRWERTYDNDSYVPVVYKSAVNKDNITPYDISAVAGLGLCYRALVGHTHFFVKFDVAYGISVLNNFSQKEVNAANAAHDESAEAVQDPFVFHGWGDIEHEELGKRRLQNVEARLTFLIPLRKPLKDACAFDQGMKKPK